MSRALPPAVAAVAAALALLAPAAQAAPGAGPEVTLLLHHPDDGVDPFGFPYSPQGDYFATRYGPLVAHKGGRFDFPFFVADGVVPIEKLPDPGMPFESARSAYEQATRQRLAEEPPATLRLASEDAGGNALVTVAVRPATGLAGEDLHLLVALAEDPVHYQPPPGLTNGVTEHRFTVRAVADLGPVAMDGPANRSHSFALGESWARDRLVVAAWLQQDAPSPRFDAREVVQATHAPLGGEVEQQRKGVLLEMLSATWCEPCLYGDLAVEAVAVAHGAAAPLETSVGPRYFESPSSPVLALAAALAAGVGVAWWGGRRPPA